MSRPRVLMTPDMQRYFLVPRGTAIHAGLFVVHTEDGERESLKEGQLTHWEITEESAELILQERAAQAGEAVAGLLEGLLAGLGVRDDNPATLLKTLATAGSQDPRDRERTLGRLKRAIKGSQDPQLTAALEALAAQLAADLGSGDSER